ncbi:family 20 glycosylhydrolase [Acidobacteriota bacterium]
MNRLHPMRVLLFFFLIGALLACTPAMERRFPTTPGIKIIPKPTALTVKVGSFVFDKNTRIEFSGEYTELMPVATALGDLFRRSAGFDLSFTPENEGAKGGVVKLEIDRLLPELGAEGYKLTVSPDLISLKAYQPAGVFYGVQTIRQLLPPEIESPDPVAIDVTWEIPCVDILDTPRFPWRGLMLDVSRHFFPTEFIYRFIDFLAMHKLNTFHWHLVDDQGWRLEIKKYPKLTEIGAWRVDHEDKHWNAREPQKPGEKATYGGFYTQEEIRDIVAYAQSRFVTIIPEIEMPGHTTAALAAYPEYSCTGGPFTVPPGGVWPITDIFCAGKDETFEFIQNILTEVIELFPSQYIHIGGDEANKQEWKVCELCQARIRSEGLQNEEGLQSYFIKRIEKYLVSLGRDLIGWDEILEGGLAPEATVMSWRGAGGGIEAARLKHKVVMSPTTHCYFDYYQGNPDNEPLAIGGYLPLKQVYTFDPIPEVLTQEEATFILGGQANLWTEYISTPSHAEYMLFPRVAALSEVVWTPKADQDWEEFASRLKKQLNRYEWGEINFAASSLQVNLDAAFIPSQKLLSVQMSTELPQPTIRYTLNGGDPSIGSIRYKNPIHLKKTTTIRTAAFLGHTQVSPIEEKTYVIHKATSKKVRIVHPYSNRYTGGGDLALVDSLQGTKNQRGGFWQGYEQYDLEAVIDLGEIQEISRLSSRYLQSLSSWIFLPTEVVYAVSEDGEEFSEVARLMNDIPPEVSDRIIKEFSQTLDRVKARYVSVHAKNIGICPEWHFGSGRKAWLFIDEIIVQ